MGNDFENSANGISAPENFVYLFFHALLGFGIGAVEQDLCLLRQGPNIIPADVFLHCCAAHGGHVT